MKLTGRWFPQIVDKTKTTQKNKSPGNDGLPSEFYKVFWNDIKVYLLKALSTSYKNKKLSITQRRGVITLLPKKRSKYTGIKIMETDNIIKPG